MSTKIYEGMIVTDTPSMYTLRNRIDVLRKQIQDTTKKELRDLIRKECALKVDSIAMGAKIYSNNRYMPELFFSIISDIEDKYREIEKTKRRNPEYDFYCEMTFIPIRNKILAMPFCERKSFSKIINGQAWLKEYGYWNNTDPDENCTPAEWRQRERDWTKALPGIGIFAQNGFSVTLTVPYLFYPERPTIAEILEKMPSYKKRVESAAFRWALNKIYAKKSALLKKEGKEFQFSDFFQAEDDLKNTEQGRKLKQKAIEHVKAKIPKRITKALLMQKLPYKERKNYGR